MQVCPCVRLRLWRQYGRDWQRLRNASPAAVAKAVRGLSQAASTINPLELADGRHGSRKHRAHLVLPESEPNKNFNKAFYNPKDKEFWDKYQEMWGDQPDDADSLAQAPGGPSIGGSQHAERGAFVLSRVGSRRPGWFKVPAKLDTFEPIVRDPERTNTSPEGDIDFDWRFFEPVNSDKAPDFFAIQMQYLMRSCKPEDRKMVRVQFWDWKRSLAKTWCMLEKGELPQELDQNDLLWWLLESEGHNSNGEDSNGSKRVAQMWEALPRQRRASQWMDLIVSTLRSRPEQAVDIFTATFDASLIPSYVSQDVLLYIFRSNTSAALPAKLSFEELFSLLKHVLENSPKNYLRLQQAALHFLLRTAETPTDVISLYRLVMEHGHPLHNNTRMQFASRLAKSSTHKAQAVEILKTAISENKLDINSAQGSALCTTILSSSPGTSSASADGIDSSTGERSTATPAEMFEELLRYGLEPNLITYTAIIRGLCSKGELESAQEVLELMLKAGTGLDAYVYSIMLNGAKTCGHYPTIRQVAEAAAAQGIRHPIVWNDFLQTIYTTALSEARSDPENKRPRVIPSFPLMLEAYGKVFQPAPLHRLLPTIGRILGDGSAQYGSSPSSLQSMASSHRQWEFSAQLAPTVRALPQLSNEELVEPTSLTLGTMVLGYIQGLSNPYDAIAFYSHFHRLLQTGDPTAVRIVRDMGSMVHDTVIMSLCEYEGMLRVALDVVGDMLRDAAAALEQPRPLELGLGTKKAAALTATEAEEKNKETSLSAAGQHPPPSVYTWSILLNGFMFHRHTKQGERILQMMTERGVKANEVTWNTLISGYARLQYSKKTAQALVRREAAGLEPNEFTFRAFSYLSDKTTVIKYLEAHRQSKAAAASAGVAAKLAEAQAPATRPSPFSKRPIARSRHPKIARELRSLEEDVDEIAQMMDEEDQQYQQQDQQYA